jgi:hypothetical protein
MAFITGYASDLYVQAEDTGIFGTPVDSIKTCRTSTSFTIDTSPASRLDRKGPSWRREKLKTLLSFNTIKLRMELRPTNVFCQLLRSLMSVYDFANGGGINCQTFQGEFNDQVRTLKMWITSNETGQTFLCEGVAVQELQIGLNSRQLAVADFALIALKVTYAPTFSLPGKGFLNTKHKHPYSAPYSNVYFTTTDFDDSNMPSFAIPWMSRIAVTINRSLTPTAFSQGKATRFKKSPVDISVAITALMTNTLWPYANVTETYGAMIVRLASDSQVWFDVMLPSVALTLSGSQLHSTTDSNPVNINVNSIQDMKATGGVALRLFVNSEGWDGGGIGQDNIYQHEGIDGGNFADTLKQPVPNISGGDFTEVD